MQQTQNDPEYFSGDGFDFGGFGGACQRGFREFQEPVAEHIPGEAVAGGGVIIETERFQRGRGLHDGSRTF